MPLKVITFIKTIPILDMSMKSGKNITSYILPSKEFIMTINRYPSMELEL